MYTYPISFPAETKSGGRIARKVSLYFCLPNVYGASVHRKYVDIRRPVPSTDQAIPSCFNFRIS